MKKLLIIITLLITQTGQAQNLGGRKVAGPVLVDGLEVNVGDTLHLVGGSNASGEFNHITIAMPMVATPIKPSAQYAGQKLIVDHFRDYGQGAVPIARYWMPVKAMKKAWFVVDLQNAVRVEEIVL